MIESNIWGPYVWYFMHCITFEQPHTNSPIIPKTLKKLNSFFLYINKLLPCPYCQKHYNQTLIKYPPSIYFTSGIGCSKWVVKIHNLVNKGLEKKIVPYPITKGMYNIDTINHSNLSAFINYILVKSKDKPLINRKKITKCTIDLFPCLKCKENLKVFDIKSIKSTEDMNVIANKILNISTKCNEK